MNNLIRTILISLFVLISISVHSVTAYFSDCQSFQTTHQQIVKQITKFHPDTVFIGGDITIRGSRQEEYDSFHSIMKPLSNIAKIYPAIGNHDKDTDLFLQNFPQVDSLTYYIVDNDEIVWIVLNSNLKLAPGSKQYNWLLNALETNQERTNVVITHHPIYSSGMHGDEKGFNLLLPPLFNKYNVAAVLSGHDHIYERSIKDSINYVVFGGAGGPLYNRESRNDYSLVFKKTHGFLIFTRDNDTLNAIAYDLDGNHIDEFKLRIKTKTPETE